MELPCPEWTVDGVSGDMVVVAEVEDLRVRREAVEGYEGHHAYVRAVLRDCVGNVVV